MTSDLLDPHIWYSNDFPWSQDVKFDLGLGWPQAASNDLGISKVFYGLKNGLFGIFPDQKSPQIFFLQFFYTFICEKVNEWLKYNLNPILRVFLKAYWAHILREELKKSCDQSKTLFEVIKQFINSEVTRGCLRSSEAEVKFDILRPGEVI